MGSLRAKDSLVGKLIVYYGSYEPVTQVRRLDAGIVKEETWKQVQTRCIFGHITRVAKSSIVGVYNPDEEEKVIAVCQQVKDMYTTCRANVKKMYHDLEDEIAKIAKRCEDGEI